MTIESTTINFTTWATEDLVTVIARLENSPTLDSYGAATLRDAQAALARKRRMAAVFAAAPSDSAF